MSLSYINISIDVERRNRQGDTISPKLFTATSQNLMRTSEWDDIGVTANLAPDRVDAAATLRAESDIT
ncbi:hypothetical protein KIN20_037554 [Parelaphostrongylus tenuis]|uniref:Uncharacterized protein n=1 Tax=Parelaphostrongylus tenuis TaxID=148309 RepID=A0AAD5RI58_PARTN|nr:hypothetical protein KIN20_037554 [Parelaphostrongylus tenuis]